MPQTGGIASKLKAGVLQTARKQFKMDGAFSAGVNVLQVIKRPPVTAMTNKTAMRIQRLGHTRNAKGESRLIATLGFDRFEKTADDLVKDGSITAAAAGQFAQFGAIWNTVQALHWTPAINAMGQTPTIYFIRDAATWRIKELSVTRSDGDSARLHVVIAFKQSDPTAPFFQST